LTLLAIAATVMVGAALAAAGTSEPATSAAKPSGELRLAMAASVHAADSMAGNTV